MVVVLALILSGCVVEPQVPLDAEQLLRTERGQIQHWRRRSVPVRILVDSGLSESYQQATLDAVWAWNQLLGFEALSVEYTEDRDEVDDPIRGTISVAERELGVNEHQVRLFGSARNTYSSRGRIRRARISLDPGIPDYAQLPVMLHEIGHALGLRHDDDNPESIMFPSIDASFCQTIQVEDVAAIRQTLL